MKNKTKVAMITSAAIASAAYAGLMAGTAVAAPMETGIRQASTQIASGLAGTYAEDSSSSDGKHDCKGKNECKGKGGCKTGDEGCKGKNSCKGKGGCSTMK